MKKLWERVATPLNPWSYHIHNMIWSKIRCKDFEGSKKPNFIDISKNRAFAKNDAIFEFSTAD